jgi:hypothetical protein
MGISAHGAVSRASLPVRLGLRGLVRCHGQDALNPGIMGRDAHGTSNHGQGCPCHATHGQGCPCYARTLVVFFSGWYRRCRGATEKAN